MRLLVQLHNQKTKMIFHSDLTQSSVTVLFTQVTFTKIPRKETHVSTLEKRIANVQAPDCKI